MSEYYIPVAALRAKGGSSQTSNSSLPVYHWYDRYQGTEEPTKLYYVTTALEIDEAASLLSESKILGFDMEWRPNFIKGGSENPVALIQLCNSQTILLCQVSSLSSLPQNLVSLLTNESIKKVGAGIAGDVNKLYRDFYVHLQGATELESLVKGGGRKPRSLKQLTEVYLQRTLAKNRLVVLGNWEAQLLDNDQIEYAANDCYCAWEIANALQSTEENGRPTHTESWLVPYVTAGDDYPDPEEWQNDKAAAQEQRRIQLSAKNGEAGSSSRPIKAAPKPRSGKGKASEEQSRLSLKDSISARVEQPPASLKEPEWDSRRPSADGVSGAGMPIAVKRKRSRWDQEGSNDLGEKRKKRKGDPEE